MKHSIVLERVDHAGAESQCPFVAQTWDVKIGDYREPDKLTHVFKFDRPRGLLSDLLHAAYIAAKRKETEMIADIEREAEKKTKEQAGQ